MKKIIAALIAATLATSVYAACSTHTIMSGGRMVMCTTCCDSWGNCTTTCF